MFKKIKKISSVVLGLSVIGIVSAGLNSSFTYQAGHADLPTPQRPDLTYTYGVPGGGGHIVSNKSVRDPGGGGSPAYDQGQPWGLADGNTGGSPANNGGDTPSPAHSHADLPTSADGDHHVSPSYSHADTWSPTNEEHGDTPSQRA
ncbi:Phr family secreted Rap phosphatase inhibitor [Bacillus cereus group sp. BfR-BA-01380]|uniref:Phr family secreted Rap phosphatase inhibitor n=1 Tax=Bacillus cereus group sp. BfR-BA-01380 TaxID=2920324 RepID=UPI001F5ACC7D